MSTANHRFSNIWDKIGIGLSVLCLVHCLTLPMIILSLPIMARFYLGNPFVHIGLAILILPVGLISFFKGYGHHHNWRPMALGFLGLVMISVTPILVHILNWNLPESLLVAVGSVVLIFAHIKNRRACNRCYHS